MRVTILAPQQYRGTRFAVVLFLLLGGESEREWGGNLPPLGCVSGRTYPSALLVDGPPRAPLGRVSERERPKAPKVHLGLPDHP